MVPPSTELPPAAWSAEADVGAERCNQVPLSRSSRCLAGRRPASGTTGHSEPEAGSLKSNGEAAAARILVATRRPGNPPVFNDAEPWRVALQAGPGTLTPWPCGRSATLASAARRNRARGHCRTTDTPQPPLWTASVKASRALSQHWLRLRPSRVARRRIAHFNLATPRPPRGRVRLRGAVDCIAPPRTGGANPVVARSVIRRTRPSRSSAPGAGRTGRCAGRPLPRDRC